MFNFFLQSFNGLYYIHESVKLQMYPLRYLIEVSRPLYKNKLNPLYNTSLGKVARASFELLDRGTKNFFKHAFDIKQCTIDDRIYKIKEKTVLAKSFCNLLHFNKVDYSKKLPKLLIVAPMAGHFATLLKNTVQDMLPYFDIYITDWIDAKQVPINQGSFDMDDYINYTIEFMEFVGKNTNVLAVCQPTVPVLAATAIMSAENNSYVPKSLILMGGPIDASKNPTKVNIFATDKSIEWFEKMVVVSVPPNYPGYMRKVFPGFLQLAGFMSLNMDRHVNSHIELFKDLVLENEANSTRQMKFYDEYLTTMDLTAEFYLQTIKEVFQNYALAKGTLVSRGRKVDLTAITKCGLLGIEGEHDDIAGVGQTEAALMMCSNIPMNRKQYYLQQGVGHYGVFSGTKFRQQIIPIIQNFIDEL